MPARKSSRSALKATTRDTDPRSDMQLLRAASAGDQRACGALFSRYELMARALGRRHFDRECDIDDLLQDAVVDALRNLHTLRNGQAFCRWFGEVEVRTMSKRCRRRRLERRHMRPFAPQERVISDRGDPSAEVLVDLAMIRERMPELTEVMALHTNHGHSLPELARRYGVSLSTTKRRIAELRAASSLRSLDIAVRATAATAPLLSSP